MTTPSVNLEGEAAWLRATTERVRRILRKQPVNRLLNLSPPDLPAHEKSAALIAVLKAGEHVDFTLQLESNPFGYMASLHVTAWFWRRKPAARVANRAQPYFGPYVTIRHEDGEPPPPRNSLVLDRRSTGESRITVWFDYVVSGLKPAPALFVVDLAFFVHTIALLLAERRVKRPTHYGSRKGPRPRSIPGRGSVLSTFACPSCATTLRSYETSCDVCDWPNPRWRNDNPYEVEPADT